MARLAELEDLTDLAKAVGVAPQRIDDYVRAERQVDFYQVIRIPKRHRRRKGQFRTVHKATSDWLAQLHRMLAILVGQQTKYPDCVQGFVGRRSIYTNARQHLAPRKLLHGDIAGFFDAITSEHVRKGFISLGCSFAMADVLARAVTIDGLLRQGTRCAPAIANLVCRQLDVDLQTLADTYGASYTRYADDLTFSGNDVPTGLQVESIVKQHGFTLRDGRCYVQLRGRAQFVTGLTVSDPLRPRLPRRLKRRMRLVLYYVEKYSAEGHFSHTDPDATGGPLWLEGMLRFFRSVEPEFAPRLQDRFQTRLAGVKSPTST